MTRFLCVWAKTNRFAGSEDPRANRSADGFDGSIQLKFCTNY